MHGLESRRKVARDVRPRLPFVEARGGSTDANVMRKAELLRRLNHGADDAKVCHGRKLDRCPILAGAVQTDRPSADGGVARPRLRPQRRTRSHADEAFGSGVDRFGQDDGRRGTPHAGRDHRHRHAIHLAGEGLEAAMIADELAVGEQSARNHLRPFWRTHEQAVLGEVTLARLEMVSATVRPDWLACVHRNPPSCLGLLRLMKTLHYLQNKVNHTGFENCSDKKLRAK